MEVGELISLITRQPFDVGNTEVDAALNTGLSRIV